MRIIAGRAGGRRIAVPPTHTRPTSDRVRESMFSALDARWEWEGLRVLDLYAGSGALGLEAASRGATDVLLVERDPAVFAVLSRNVETLALPGVRVLRSDVAAAAGRPADAAFDLVLCDPPYDLPAADVRAVLSDLARNGWVAMDGEAVVERSARDRESPWPDEWRGDRHRTIGETALWYGHVMGQGTEEPT